MLIILIINILCETLWYRHGLCEKYFRSCWQLAFLFLLFFVYSFYDHNLCEYFVGKKKKQGRNWKLLIKETSTIIAIMKLKIVLDLDFF